MRILGIQMELFATNAMCMAVSVIITAMVALEVAPLVDNELPGAIIQSSLILGAVLVMGSAVIILVMTSEKYIEDNFEIVALLILLLLIVDCGSLNGAIRSTAFFEPTLFVHGVLSILFFCIIASHLFCEWHDCVRRLKKNKEVHDQSDA